MIRTVVKLVCVAVCVGMTWWLVRYEAFPGWFADSFSGYRGMMSNGALLVDSWTKVLYDGEPIGYSHTQLAAPEDSTEEATRLENRTVLNMKVLGATQRINATASAALDSGHRLQRFSFVLHSSQYRARIEGERRQGETFAVRIHTAAGESETEVVIPDDVVVYSPMTEMAMRRLKPGQRLRIKTLDPVSLRVVNVICDAVRRETITLGGQEISATLLNIGYQGMVMQSWMNDQGKVVRQETPLGWVMETCSQDEAMSLEFDASSMDDMILANSVPVTGGVIVPGQVRTLTLKLSGLHLPPEQLVSPRQEVEALSATEARVVLHAAKLPATAPPIGNHPDGMEEFLASTPFIQADHPEIMAQARKIVGNTTDSLEATRRLYDWVSRKVTKSATVSLPSALDVLHQRVGDCNEHTYLYVALSRALGIPAQIRIGLVFSRGAFYYHAWPAVWLGEWVEIDPTLEQPEADATHLALLEGELGKQLELMKVIGRLRAHVESEAVSR